MKNYIQRYFQKYLWPLKYAFETALTPVSVTSLHINLFNPFAFITSIISKRYLVHYHRPHTLLLENIPPASTLSIKAPILLHIISNLEIGGSQKIIFDLATHFQTKIEVVITDIHNHIIFNTKTRTISPLTSARQLLDQIKPDLIHLHYYGDTWGMHQFLDRLLPLVSKTPVIENVNNPLPLYEHQSIKQYIFVSHFAQSIQKKTFKNATVIYPGVDTNLFKPERTISKINNIGLVYRLTNDKLNEETIDYLVQIAKSAPQVFFHIVGSGPNFSVYVRKIRQAGLRSRFRFYGWVPYAKLPSIYNRIDLYLAPVHTESYGIVVPYAMAKNIPVIGINTGAVPEILGDKGIICRSTTELVQSTIKVINHPNAITIRSATSSSRVNRHFSLNRMINQYQELYQQYLTF